MHFTVCSIFQNLMIVFKSQHSIFNKANEAVIVDFNDQQAVGIIEYRACQSLRAEFPIACSLHPLIPSAIFVDAASGALEYAIGEHCCKPFKRTLEGFILLKKNRRY
ncbi:MAG: hypothetical protein JWR61_1324 [Ferruginibacter sp.]|uniref:hypothetical protein n=1 Tax=Ferruginibacter sp. TaxID=1940288 RepID=UPI00265AA1FB|nr:hypothetical protein [Ferruginibacter sp.]MDB5276369.1 hypothetical protein [Ferruginibacter sp.]